MLTDLLEESHINEYRVESVEKTDPPAGVAGGNWQRYVIGRGTSKIAGLKQGSVRDVRAHAEAMADDLNERAQKRGSSYASRNKK